MSLGNFNFDDFERWVTKFQFRSSRKHRFRVVGSPGTELEFAL